MKKIINTLLLLLVVCSSYAQEENKHLAMKYYMDQEFEKSAELFEQLYKKKRTKNNFNYLLKSYIAVSDLKKAEKLISSAHKASPNDATYTVEHIGLLKLQGKKEKAEKAFKKLLDNLPPKQHSVSNTANILLSKSEYEYALEVIAHGIKIIGNKELFRYNKARIYAIQRNYEAMLIEYLEMLKTSRKFYNVVQNNLQYHLGHDVNNNLANEIKKQLLIYTNKYPDNSPYTELLIWIYLQEKKFNLAYIHVRALDMRYHSSGDQLMQFGELSMQNNAFLAAEKAFKAILLFGEKAKPDNLQKAKMGLLEATFDRLAASQTTNQQELEALQKEIISFIDSQPNGLSFQFIKRLSELQAYYLQQPEAAVENVNQLLESKKIFPSDRVDIEMLLADLLLSSGDPWEATLAYARIEKANKHNQQGHEAKFRKTRVAYFTGDFQWAKSQLDILKASTTKLIANDAFALSLILKDNMDEEEDSISPALQQFANAQMLILQKQNANALLTLDSIIITNKQEIIAEYSVIEKAKLLTNMKQYEKAVEIYQILIDTYAFSIWSDDALFYQALLYEQQLNLPEKAMVALKKLMLEHKGSVFVIEARKHFRNLRGDKPSSKDEAEFHQSINK